MKNKLLKEILFIPMNVLYRINPTLTQKTLFLLLNHYPLNLQDPATYNEKIQWIKLHYRHELMPLCADKFHVRKYVEQCGSGYLLNELYWDGLDAEDIPFEELPEHFVIKVTHGSTYNILCKNKADLNRDQTIRKLKAWMKKEYRLCYGEWFYSVVKPRIIIEKYLDGGNGEPPADYKVWCFGGKPAYIVVDTDRFCGHKRDMYDTDWNYVRYDTSHPHGQLAQRPACLEKLLYEAEKLSKPFPHARIDFYITGEKIIFGEITFTNGAGFTRMRPREIELSLGGLIDLKSIPGELTV
ncbi:MAG: ATP-grasp fold amidoligase family protein [Christensenellales bacterium]